MFVAHVSIVVLEVLLVGFHKAVSLLHGGCCSLIVFYFAINYFDYRSVQSFKNSFAKHGELCIHFLVLKDPD